jgi:quercetin dioxygenase-like cupin family protein
MSHTVGAAHRRESHPVEEEREAGHVLAGEGKRTLWVMGELLTQKIPGRTTGGAYSLFEVATPPGAGPPPHVNHREDEAFYVLEGGYEFLVDEHRLRAEAGASTAGR